ncbi:hypothetical protein FHU38_002863 [Saccharomonospora amisosensis]|uniref:Uncharacterized protein n=1 Tax=Saccharomonospora amisosensis TaxID=1128677 RepID=A0A7X5ZR52_9PSEU|nr:hypothetical protein [Saccharomonospora amisosensis]
MTIDAARVVALGVSVSTAICLMALMAANQPDQPPTSATGTAVQSERPFPPPTGVGAPGEAVPPAPTTAPPVSTSHAS